jgi:streptogramin lyase
MSKDPAQRFASAGDLARAATAAARGEATPRRERSVAAGAAAPAGEKQHGRRPRAMLAVAIGLASAAILVAALVAADGDGGGAAQGGDRGPLRVAGTPGAIALAGGAVWTMTREGGALQRTDARTGRSTALRAPVDLGGGEFSALEGGGDALWQVQSFAAGGGVTKIDPRNGDALGRVGVAGASAVAAEAGAAWATGRQGGRGQLVRIEPDRVLIVRGPVAAGRDPVAVAHAGGSLWVADRRRNSVLAYEPRTLRLRARIQVGDGPGELASAAGQLWVANLGDRTLTRIDPARAVVVGAQISLGKEIQAITGFAETLWVASADATVVRLDGRTGAARGPAVNVGRPPLSVVADRNGAWVASETDRTIQHLSPPRGTAG